MSDIANGYIIEACVLSFIFLIFVILSFVQVINSYIVDKEGFLGTLNVKNVFRNCSLLMSVFGLVACLDPNSLFGTIAALHVFHIMIYCILFNCLISIKFRFDGNKVLFLYQIQ